MPFFANVNGKNVLNEYHLDEGVSEAIERVPLASFEENVERDGVTEEVKEVRCEEFQNRPEDLFGNAVGDMYYI